MNKVECDLCKIQADCQNGDLPEWAVINVRKAPDKVPLKTKNVCGDCLGKVMRVLEPGTNPQCGYPTSFNGGSGTSVNG